MACLSERMSNFATQDCRYTTITAIIYKDEQIP